MITSLIYLVIWLIVIGLICSVLMYAVQKLPLPAPFGQVARVVIIVIGCLCVVLLLLQFMGAVGPMPRLAP
jgi:hypothetical protein